MFFSILKGASKAEITKEVKQNGNYALSVMERMIRNAQKIDCINAPGSIKITNPDSGETTFSLTGARVASNSAYLTSEKLSLSSASFTCQTTAPETVTILFTLSQAGAGAKIEEKAQVSFQTTISLRVYD